MASFQHVLPFYISQMSFLNKVNNGFGALCQTFPLTFGLHFLFITIKNPPITHSFKRSWIPTKFPFIPYSKQKQKGKDHTPHLKESIPKAKSDWQQQQRATCIYTQDPIFILPYSCIYILAGLHPQPPLGFPKKNGRDCSCRASLC